MPSHLTRHVFRRLLANEPIIYRGCLRRRRYGSWTQKAVATRPLTSSNGMSWTNHEQRRAFFNFNMFANRQEVKEADMDPGIEKMMELAKRQRMKARLPPVEDVVDAFRQFFAAKRDKRQPLNDDQAHLALLSFQYCERVKRDRKQEPTADYRQAACGTIAINRAADVLLCDRSPSKASLEFSRALLDAAPSSRMNQTNKRCFAALIHTLCRQGLPLEARDLVLQNEKNVEVHTQATEPAVASEQRDRESEERLDLIETETPASSAHESSPGAGAKIWSMILHSVARQGDDAQVRQTFAMIEERGLAAFRSVHGAMLDHSLRRDNVGDIRYWWASYLGQCTAFDEQHSEPSELMKYSDTRLAGRLEDVLKWCLAHDELETGQIIVRQVMISNPTKPVWDAVFIWAAGTKKSVDEIGRMMDVMERSNDSISDPVQRRVPDIATINGLVEFAISRNDPYMAERFIALGKERYIEPDAKTYVLQMEYRLRVDDVDGALIAYTNLQAMDLSSNEDVPTVNHLLVALCNTQRHDFDTIMNVAADLSDRRVRFDPATVTALSLLHLNRDEFHDVIDLLNTHAFHYSSAERESIRNTIVDYALNPDTATSRAWESYTILRTVFDELPRPRRTDIMISFFNRERPDMGVHVFQNMRMHSRADTFPTIDTYAAAFMSLAKLRELESLEVIHNLLKLDYNINVNTYLYNTLIIAYTACGKARTALNFWDDIVASREGPSYNSIHVALRACEKSPFGDLRAKEIWSMLRRRNVDLDHNLWASYVAALAGNGDNDLALSTLEQAIEKGEVEVDAFLLGSLFAGAAGQSKQAEVEVWGKERFPRQWEELEGFGVDVEENFMRGFRIDRRVAP